MGCKPAMILAHDLAADPVVSKQLGESFLPIVLEDVAESHAGIGANLNNGSGAIQQLQSLEVAVVTGSRALARLLVAVSTTRPHSLPPRQRC